MFLLHYTSCLFNSHLRLVCISLPYPTNKALPHLNQHSSVLRSAKRVSANVRRLNNISDIIFYCSVGERLQALALLNAAQAPIKPSYLSTFQHIPALTPTHQVYDTPPPKTHTHTYLALPSMGCRFRICRGPLAREWILSSTMCFSLW